MSENGQEKTYGVLIPAGGGDPIPLLKKQLRVGRRESCDIVLRFANVSAHHCLLTVDEGYWFVKDMNSRNGIKVNGTRVPPNIRKRLDPGATLSVARHKYEVKYEPADLGAVGPPPADDTVEYTMSQSLLKRAGLQRRDDKRDDKKEEEKDTRFDILDDNPRKSKRKADDDA